MADSASIDLAGGSPIASSLLRLGALLGPDERSQSLLLMGAYISGEVGNAFDQQKDMVTGARWPELSRLTTRRPGRGSSAKALRDTGGLQRAVMAMQPVVQSGDVVSIGLGAAGNTRVRGGTITLSELAAIHNGPISGAQRGPIIIRPKNAKLLAFPVSDEAYTVGRAKEFVRQKRSAGKIIKSGVNPQTDEWGLYEVRGSQMIQHFIYARQVSLPGRRSMGMGPNQERDLIGLIDATVARAILDMPFFKRQATRGRDLLNRIRGSY